jgi:glutathione S-transferase
VAIGEVMIGGTAGEVVQSNHPDFAPGDKVVGALGWQLFGVADGGVLQKVDPSVIHLSAWLGPVGMPGVTAWIGLFDICAPKPGDTVVVTAASGAVGSVVGQLAKIHGARAIGIAGGADKCRYVTEELGFAACIDYKAHNGDFVAGGKALKEACPDGIDGYFENVGGWILDAVMLRMNAFGRIAVCGMIAGYDGAAPGHGQPGAHPHQPHEGAGLHRQRAHGGLARGAQGTGPARGQRHAAPARERGPGPGGCARGLPGHAQGQELRQAARQAGLNPLTTTAGGPMDTLILHHYPASPFAEKIRRVLAFKQLAYRSVIIPDVMPKPDVLALTGGYRRTPILQIGADIYCDTALICQVLEQRSAEPALYPPHLLGVSRIVAQWADSTLFWAAMAYNLQPRGAAALFAQQPPEAAKAFAADRGAMSAGMQRLRPQDATAAYRSYLRRIAHMVEEHVFLFGDQPCVADFAAYHPLWFTRVCVPTMADIFEPVPAVLEWMDRIAVLGPARMEKFKAEDAITVAANAEPAPLLDDVFQDEHGIPLGSQVTVAAESFGQEPTQGTLLAATRTRYTLRREDPRAGTVHVHFPRIGYVLRKAEQ